MDKAALCCLSNEVTGVVRDRDGRDRRRGLCCVFIIRQYSL